MSEFKTKAEAQQAIQDMERRAATAERLVSVASTEAAKGDYRNSMRACLAEADRIRALLPTLPGVCGCEQWRPAGAGDDWHLATCGIAPAPTSLRLV